MTNIGKIGASVASTAAKKIRGQGNPDDITVFITGNQGIPLPSGKRYPSIDAAKEAALSTQNAMRHLVVFAAPRKTPLEKLIEMAKANGADREKILDALTSSPLPKGESNTKSNPNSIRGKKAARREVTSSRSLDIQA